MRLFNGPCKYSSIGTLVVPWGSSLNVRAYLSVSFVCVLVYLCQTTRPLQWRMVLSAMSHSAGSLWHDGALNVLTWVWGRRNADFISPQIMRLKKCHLKMEFQPFLLQRHTAEGTFSDLMRLCFRSIICKVRNTMVCIDKYFNKVRVTTFIQIFNIYHICQFPIWDSGYVCIHFWQEKSCLFGLIGWFFSPEADFMLHMIMWLPVLWNA